MKKQLIIFFLMTVCIILIVCQKDNDKPYLIQIEAEYGDYSELALKHNITASGRSFLQMADSGQVAWSLHVPDSGYYQVVFRYRAGEGDKAQILIKNGESIAIGFNMAKRWHLFAQSFYLKKGSNELGLKAGWGHMDVDWIGIEPADVAPAITPHQATFYTNHPNPLRFKIDNWHQKIQNVLIGQQSVDFEVIPYPHQESAVWLEISPQVVSHIDAGNRELVVQLEKSEIKAQIQILPRPKPSQFMIVAPDVNHGGSVILQAPTGRYLMIDCGKAWVRDSILIPMLQRHHIDTVQTLILTHYHEDHDSEDKGQTIINQFHVQQVIDYQTYPTGHIWHQDSLAFKVLNSYENGKDENRRSLTLRISYHDFVYLHDGDIYADNQARILSQFPNDIQANVYAANHHFHGSVNPEYIIAVNPDLVFIQAQEAIYARPAYMVKYRQKALEPLNKIRPSPVESLAALEVGAIVIRVKSTENWTYETYRNQDEVLIPGFKKSVVGDFE